MWTPTVKQNRSNPSYGGSRHGSNSRSVFLDIDTYQHSPYHWTPSLPSQLHVLELPHSHASPDPAQSSTSPTPKVDPTSTELRHLTHHTPHPQTSNNSYDEDVSSSSTSSSERIYRRSCIHTLTARLLNYQPARHPTSGGRCGAQSRPRLGNNSPDWSDLPTVDLKRSGSSAGQRGHQLEGTQESRTHPEHRVVDLDPSDCYAITATKIEKPDLR